MVRDLARLGWVIEILLYLAGALLLTAGAVLVLGDAVSALWKGASTSARASLILDQVLLMFVLVEVLHTVRFAIAGHRLQAEPFLVWR